MHTIYDQLFEGYDISVQDQNIYKPKGIPSLQILSGVWKWEHQL